MTKNGSASTQPSHCDDLHERLAAYIAGALSREEIEHTQKLLDECLETPVSLETYVTLIDTFANNIPAVEPPDTLHQSLMQKVRAKNKQPKNMPD